MAFGTGEQAAEKPATISVTRFITSLPQRWFEATTYHDDLWIWRQTPKALPNSDRVLGRAGPSGSRNVSCGLSSANLPGNGQYGY